MCGIAGLIPRVHQSREAVLTMAKSLEHRGPDDHGITTFPAGGPVDGLPDDAFITAPVFIHQRLSILDLSPAGRQPMASPDGRHHIVFNGEIYNFIELRAELEGLGHTFHSDSDTEVLLAAYVQWGEKALGRLVGMFAFVILDREERSLFFARDPFGIKPLFYAHGPEGLAFASEIATLLDLSWVPRSADIERVHHYLTTAAGGPTDGTETLFSHVRQVPPAHWMRLDLDDPRPTPPVCYWQVDPRNRTDVPYDEAVRTVREMFLKNVRLHLRSDVPVGAALSGGIDSSAIVMAMRHLGGPEQRIHTFSYIADDPKLSEESWIDLVTKEAGATPHKVRPDVLTFLEDLPRLIRKQGEPFGSTSIYAQYCVFRAANEAGIKVTLDGQGADEVLAGYRYYYPARLASLVSSGRIFAAARLYRRMARMPGVDPKALAVETMERFIPRKMARTLVRLGLAGRHLRPDWIDTEWFKKRGARPELDRKTARRALARDLARTATKTSLPILLRYADRNSMAFSVESRVPFLTPGFVSYLLSLPESYHIGPDGTTKRVFRDAMRGLVPDAVLDRKDKIGFATTEKEWIQALEIYLGDLLDSDAAKRVPFLRRDIMKRQWDEIKSGKRPYTWAVWRWINLVQWTIEFDVSYTDETRPVVVPVEAPQTVPVPDELPAPFATVSGIFDDIGRMPPSHPL
ncbi:MAG: asparagine synthase (glutamine-hydrolyzing) [Euryarchaeota archaeon]|nr:asparagine synthase (glutamine-hydrolyzing) [Euryarchaeota archaeon]